MTTPFGMPTFVKVGKKKTPKQLGAPGTVRPPTEAGEASLGPDVTAYDDQDPAGYSHEYVSNFGVGDQLLMAVFSRSGSDSANDVHSITGDTWTQLDAVSAGGTVRLSVWSRIANGTEGTSVTVANTGTDVLDMASLMWWVRAGSIDFSTKTPDVSIRNLPANDPPPITPSHGAKDYFVFALEAWANSDLDAAPSGYAFMRSDDPGAGKNFDPRISIAQKKVTISTSEDPGVFTMTNTAGQQPMSGTVALLAEQDPELPSFGHTHVEADITDRADVLPFSKSGTLAVATGALKFPAPFAMTLVGVRAAVGTAPTGASLIVDVNKNGTTVYTTPANRPTISAAGTSSTETVPDVTAVAAGDLLSVDIDQVGSSTAGSDLVVAIEYQVD